MPIETNGTPVLAKLGKDIVARPQHGRLGWWKKEPVIYYQNIGWVSVTERATFAEQNWSCGTVFASRYSRVPAAEVDGTWGWRWQGHGLRRIRVIFQNGKGWVTLEN